MALSVSLVKNPLHPAPNAATSNTVNAMMTGSLLPEKVRLLNIDARLG
jgi:hypothetical protein